MHAGNRAMRRARFLRKKLAADIISGVLRQWNPGITALLRAVVHQPVLTDVEKARTRAAAPLVRLAQGDILLEAVQPGIAQLTQLPDLIEYSLRLCGQRFQLTAIIVN